MAATASLNIRLPEDLKERGMQVLDREGVSVSELVRSLFSEMEREQAIPSFLSEQLSLSAQIEIQRRRDALRSMVGVVAVAPGFDACEAWYEHLEQKHS